MDSALQCPWSKASGNRSGLVLKRSSGGGGRRGASAILHGHSDNVEELCKVLDTLHVQSIPNVHGVKVQRCCPAQRVAQHPCQTRLRSLGAAIAVAASAAA